MGHPQPAFDFLISLPDGVDVDESVFADWWAWDSVDAKKGDDVRDYPEIWEDWELPGRLEELSTDDIASLQRFSGRINLNAAAIGLGLEDVTYEPEVFSGLEYNPAGVSATVFVFIKGVVFAVGDTEESTVEALTQVFNRLESFDLDDEASFGPDIQTGRVSEFL